MLPFGWGLEGERQFAVFSKTNTLAGRLFAAVLFLLTTIPVLAQVPGSFRPNLALLRSPHTDGNLTETRVLQALWYAAAELNISPDKLPRIIVVHGGRDIGTVAGIPLWNWNSGQKSSGAVVAEPLPEGEKLYYLWVIGKPSDEVLVMGFVQILKPESPAHDADLVASAKRVLARMESVVNVRDLQNGMFQRAPGIVP